MWGVANDSLRKNYDCTNCFVNKQKWKVQSVQYKWPRISSAVITTACFTSKNTPTILNIELLIFHCCWLVLCHWWQTSRSKLIALSSVKIVPLHAYVCIQAMGYRYHVSGSLTHTQVSPPDFHPENDQMTVMRAAVSQSHMDDEALEDLSKVGWPTASPSLLFCLNDWLMSMRFQTREPPVEDNKGSPTRHVSSLPKFADWAAGDMPQLGAEMVKKHVAKMVDVSFCLNCIARLLLPIGELK